jgi:hypothetical protein
VERMLDENPPMPLDEIDNGGELTPYVVCRA